MATKRKRDDEKTVVYSADTLKALLSYAIITHDPQAAALLNIMKAYNFDPGMLEEVLMGPSFFFFFIGTDLGSDRLFRSSTKH